MTILRRHPLSHPAGGESGVKKAASDAEYVFVETGNDCFDPHVTVLVLGLRVCGGCGGGTGVVDGTCNGTKWAFLLPSSAETRTLERATVCSRGVNACKHCVALY